MALKLQEGFKKLASTIELEVAGFHKDYKRVNELAELYFLLITGDEEGKLLEQFTPREDATQFKQRVNLTQLITPSITEKIMQPFYKVSRIDNVKKGVIFEGKGNSETDKNIKEVEKAFLGFNGDISLDGFMETEYVDLMFTDPNAFIIVEFDDFDEKEMKAKPFPYIASSKEAINYKYVNNVLEYLVVRKEIEYLSEVKGKASKKEGFEFRIYLNDNVIKLVQVDEKLGGIEWSNIDIDEWEDISRVKIGGDVFAISVGEPNAGQVQACRVGYKRDIATQGRTMVSPMQPAVPRMMKTIKSISELDLTTTLHTFPQKIQYVENCKGVTGDTCRGGRNQKNGKCKECKGSGVSIHKSSADAITFPMPKDKEDMMDLNNLLVYKNPPVELIKWQDEYIEKLERKSLTDVFVSESLSQATKTMTATEKELDMESIYDTLFPYANKFSSCYIKFGTITAIFIDNEKAVIIHKFPKDFKLKTERALLADLKAAKDADAPPFLKTEIENDIATKVYADNPIMMRKYKVKQQHIPFSGKTPEEITMSINMNLTTKFDKILYANFDSIIQEIEQEGIGNEVDFYLMPYDKRAEVIKAKVDQYVTKIDDEKSSASSFNSEDLDEGE